jgi:hypothetical protein
MVLTSVFDRQKNLLHKENAMVSSGLEVTTLVELKKEQKRII